MTLTMDHSSLGWPWHSSGTYRALDGRGGMDNWELDLVYWGAENKFLERKRHAKKEKLKKPFAATQMGLIYVNREGANGKPDPLLAAKTIRETFGRMCRSRAHSGKN
jgi:catalase (peroxidase I)